MRKLLQNKKAGFTLIELMIVVAILGILAAIAIPAFVTYIRRAKSAEATDQVKKMYNAASVYYDKAHMASGALDASAFEHCSVAVVAEGTIFTPTSEKQTGDYAAVSSFAQNGGLGFNVEFAYYDYSIPVSTAACTGGANNTGVYTLRARGDLDGDGTFSTFDLAVGSNEENELYHARSFYITNETE